MNTLHKWALAVTVGSFALVAGDASANLLTNPSFELPDVTDGDVAGSTGWTQFNDAFTHETAAIPAQHGDQVLKLFGPFFPGGGAGVVQGGFAASAGQLWEASAYLRNDSDDAMQGSNFAVVKIEFLDGASAIIGAIESAPFTTADPADTWTLRSVQGESPVGTVAAQIVLVHVQANDPVTGGAVFFDNASLAVIPEPASLALLGVGGLLALRRRWCN